MIALRGPHRLDTEFIDHETPEEGDGLAGGPHDPVIEPGGGAVFDENSTGSHPSEVGRVNDDLFDRPYIRWYWPDDDIWCYEELDAERRAWRHVEVRGQDGVIVAAGSLSEVMAASDSGGIDAVRKYESRYGVVPEAPFSTDVTGYRLEEITAGEFEMLWLRGRQSLGS